MVFILIDKLMLILLSKLIIIYKYNCTEFKLIKSTVLASISVDLPMISSVTGQLIIDMTSDLQNITVMMDLFIQLTKKKKKEWLTFTIPHHISRNGKLYVGASTQTPEYYCFLYEIE